MPVVFLIPFVVNVRQQLLSECTGGYWIQIPAACSLLTVVVQGFRSQAGYPLYCLTIVHGFIPPSPGCHDRVIVGCQVLTLVIDLFAVICPSPPSSSAILREPSARLGNVVPLHLFETITETLYCFVVFSGVTEYDSLDSMVVHNVNI